MPVPIAREMPITLQRPTVSDGMAVHRLIAACPPLDRNSAYCNLLMCTHFAATSIVARRGGQLVGFIAAYPPPQEQGKLFVWQVAVADTARGQGLAGRMLIDLLARPACAQVQFLQTSVTPDNTASRALFAALGRRLSAPVTERLWFARERDFGGAHADELLLEIGPFFHAH